ncbi:hypothetical protein MNV49_005037 [Pseudohyphozyma bogoriensis]|nr:hypothetical protein MNV49_005037 [Pseudohyphozyma bogoriensis]
MSQGRHHPPAPANFPLLKAHEILEACHQAGLPISDDDLARPSAPRVQAILAWWLNLIFHVTVDMCINAAEAQLDHMENPEIYREGMYLGVFHAALNQLLQRAAIEDFTVSDLSNPTALRFTVILSGIINFNLFERELAAKHLEPIEQEDAVLQQREEELMVKNQAMKTKIEEEREKRRLNEARTAQCLQQTAELNHQMEKYHDESQVLTETLKNKSDTVKDLAGQLSDVNQTILNQEMEINRLKGQIVQSPDRLRSNVADMQRNLNQDKENVAQLEVKERQLTSKISALTKYEVDLGGVIKVMDEWEVDAARVKDIMKRHQQHADELDSLTSERTELERQIYTTQRRVDNSRAELARFEERTQNRRAVNRQKKKTLESQHREWMEKKRELDSQAGAKNKEAVEVESKIRELRNDLHKELDRGSMDFNRIKMQFSAYSARLNKALDGIMATATLSSPPSPDTTMKALTLHSAPQPFTPGKVYHPIQVSDVPIPVADEAKHEVLVKILYAAYNHRDLFQRQSLYPGIVFATPESPSIMGADGVGIVISPSHPLHNKVVLLCSNNNWEASPLAPEKPLQSGILGSMKLTGGRGTFAEYIVMDEKNVVECPEHLSGSEESLAVASSVPLGGVTAWRAVKTKANVDAGQNVLITGIGGGVALNALQYCVAIDSSASLGANVWVSSSSEEKIEKAVALGAKGGVNYKDPSWPKTLAGLLPKEQPLLDAVIDSGGGTIVNDVTRIMKYGGVVVCYGMTGLGDVKIGMGAVLKNIEFKGSTMGSLREFKEAVSFINEKKINFVVDTVLDGLDKAEEGFERMKEGKQFGKIVIKVAKEKTDKL